MGYCAMKSFSLSCSRRWRKVLDTSRTFTLAIRRRISFAFVSQERERGSLHDEAKKHQLSPFFHILMIGKLPIALQGNVWYLIPVLYLQKPVNKENGREVHRICSSYLKVG